MSADQTPIPNNQADELTLEFKDYVNDIKIYLSSDRDWKINDYIVPERNASTRSIRRINFAIEYQRKNPISGKFQTMILVEFHYDLDESPAMRVTAMCPILDISREEYLCGTNDTYPFDSTNIEGLQTIHISPMMEKINEMVYEGADIDTWWSR